MMSTVNGESETIWVGDTRYSRHHPGDPWQVERGAVGTATTIRAGSWLRNAATAARIVDPVARPSSTTIATRACTSGGASIHSTGSSPGFITEAVPLVLTSIQRRLDSLTIDEFADVSSRDSPALLS